VTGAARGEACRCDLGSGTVHVLAVAVLLLATLGTVMALGSALVARHRAAAAADLAALAAADRAVEGSATACAAATAVAAHHAAQLAECRLAGDVVEVTVTVPLPVGMRALGPAIAHARAGPGDTVTGLSWLPAANPCCATTRPAGQNS
jgi:secretion/DNA translocation related TadE-like protein